MPGFRSLFFLLSFGSALLMASCQSNTSFVSDSRPVEHEQWDALLRQHVDERGKVDYEGFLADSLALHQYLALLSSAYPNGQHWTREEQMAYWINAYNAFTIQLVLRHYPLESIKDIVALNIPFINSPWDIPFITIEGQEMDLNYIEHDILRTKFQEPRIHFAIVCASNSCPNLRKEAYRAKDLEAQLQEQAVQFVNDPSKHELGKQEVRISKIFDWFEGDFTKQGTIVDFLNQYASQQIALDAKVQYMDYDWRLNGQ